MVLWGKAREAQEKEAAAAAPAPVRAVPVPTDEELGKESTAPPAAAAANGETKWRDLIVLIMAYMLKANFADRRAARWQWTPMLTLRSE